MITEVEGGILISIKLTPKGSKNEVIGWVNDELAIKVCAPPVEGAANRTLLKFLAKLLETNLSSVRIHSGEKSRHKRIFIVGMTKENALLKLL